MIPSVMLIILLLGIPLGAGPQNACLGLALICALVLAKRKSRPLKLAWHRFHVPVLLASVYLIWAVGVDFLSNNEPIMDSIRYGLGFGLWVLTPIFCAPWLRLSKGRNKTIINWAIVLISLLWLGTSILQYQFGYKLVGMQLVDAHHYRASGLYSHPLTLAYGVLLLWPLFLFRVLRAPFKAIHWFGFLVLAWLLYASMSRTVIVAALMVVIIVLIQQASSKWRFATLGLALAIAAAVMVTENPVSQKFSQTFFGAGSDSHSPYPDDRLVFWKAHYQMWLEAPLTGQGFHWTDESRAPYYEQIGFGDFPKKYSAHNQYLQTAVNSGLVGLGLLFAWFFWHVRLGKSREHDYKDFTGQIRLITLLAFGGACLTQNAFFDAEVRYILIVLTTLLWAYEFEEYQFEGPH